MKKIVFTLFLTAALIVSSILPVAAFSTDPKRSFTLKQESDRSFDIISRYGKSIIQAANALDIPHEVLVKLIAVTSGGNPWANNPMASAKGLTMIDDQTFDKAQNALAGWDILIPNDPFDPKANIFAGAWYLDRIFKDRMARLPSAHLDRYNINDWEEALAFYTAELNSRRSVSYSRYPAFDGGKGFE